MKYISITEEIAKFKQDKNKIYNYNYYEHGFEMGFGKAGTYKGHSHLFFYDILYSPLGFNCFDINNKPYFGSLLVVPPKTYFSKIITQSFWFIKFSPSPKIVVLPEKTEEKYAKGTIECYNSNINLSFVWYPSQKTKETIKLSMNKKSLYLLLAKKYKFIITV